MTKKTGFIGLGAMGHPMAQNILKAGIPLVIHDIDADKTKILSESGAIVASSPMEVAKIADRIVCLVETTDQANDVICGPDGIIHGASIGSIVICMSTIDPLVAKRIGAGLDKKNIRMLDAPVSGGTGRATCVDNDCSCKCGDTLYCKMTPSGENTGSSIVIVVIVLVPNY